MRELTVVELEQVEGGNPLVIGAVVAGVTIIAACGVATYAIYKECEGSVEVSSEGVKIEFNCKK
ncbi:hypothetical protein [Arenimonas fontis]|uniref:Class IIb bacteriocin, lactobin A/cerein 7B family n=1 Tax=Arenimonas fontis TaxID=2608255 RepID=A0A5B2ZBP3_9GAMM|nr:hypothetical protein [Arenimonas fontis]KAA2284963.1 hypothetical protein F0415_06860 [Arenimonas fontis]HLT05582.1 hypothetical protein [Pseudomonas sp.]